MSKPRELIEGETIVFRGGPHDGFVGALPGRDGLEVQSTSDIATTPGRTIQYLWLGEFSDGGHPVLVFDDRDEAERGHQT